MFKRTILFLLFLLLFDTVAFASPPAIPKDIQSDLNGFNGKVGVYAKNLKTGKTISYNQDMVFPTASTSKLVVTLAVYKYLYPSAPQDKKTLYDQDVHQMIIISDNPSFYELLAEIDGNRSDALSLVIRDLKLKNTEIHNDEAFKRYSYHSVTTPYEMGTVLQSLYDDKYLGKERSDQLKNLLANTIYHDEIPRFMQTKVMHKVGELDNILCDVGIIDDGKDQILVSFYTRSDCHDPYASDFIAHESAKLYNALRHK